LLFGAHWKLAGLAQASVWRRRGKENSLETDGSRKNDIKASVPVNKCGNTLIGKMFIPVEFIRGFF